MILSGPTTWENSYLSRLMKYPEVGWLYGSLPTKIIGSGRQTALLPAVDREEATRRTDLFLEKTVTSEIFQS